MARCSAEPAYILKRRSQSKKSGIVDQDDFHVRPRVVQRQRDPLATTAKVAAKKIGCPPRAADREEVFCPRCVTVHLCQIQNRGDKKMRRIMVSE